MNVVRGRGLVVGVLVMTLSVTACSVDHPAVAGSEEPWDFIDKGILSEGSALELTLRCPATGASNWVGQMTATTKGAT
jgi:hypothetical protein